MAVAVARAPEVELETERSGELSGEATKVRGKLNLDPMVEVWQDDKVKQAARCYQWWARR